MKSTRKMLFIGLCILGTALSANAQLKVFSDGSVFIKCDTVYGRTDANIGCHRSGMTYLYDNYYETGLRTYTYNTESNGHCIGESPGTVLLDYFFTQKFCSLRNK